MVESRPWGARLLEAVPVPPVWTGLALALLFSAAFTALELASGRLERVLSGELSSVTFRAPVSLMLLIGYLPAAQLYLTRWTRAHLAAIRPLLDRPEAADLDLSLSRVAGLVGAAIWFGLFLVPFTPVSTWMDPEAWRQGLLVPALAVPVSGWLLGRFGHALVRDALRISALASRLERVDLLDSEPLSPFVHQGLRGALLMALLLSVSASISLAPEQAVVQSTAMLAAWIATGVAALVIPVRGLHRRIGDEKRAQLSTLRARISADRDTVLRDKPEADRIAARLPGLLALEARLDAVHEWPFDAPALIRFGFYVLLGIGSWLGAAGVERMLDRLLT